MRFLDFKPRKQAAIDEIYAAGPLGSGQMFFSRGIIDSPHAEAVVKCQIACLFIEQVEVRLMAMDRRMTVHACSDGSRLEVLLCAWPPSGHPVDLPYLMRQWSDYADALWADCVKARWDGSSFGQILEAARWFRTSMDAESRSYMRRLRKFPRRLSAPMLPRRRLAPERSASRRMDCRPNNR